MSDKKNIIERIKIFFTEVKGELKKVTFPSKEEMYKTTIAVIVSSFIFGIYLAVVDYGAFQLFEKIQGLFK